MRVLVLFVLLSMPVLATGQVLAQNQPKTSASGSQSNQTPRHPGDYCTSHCRADEVPCGRGCISANGTKKCAESVTTTCAGKP